MSFEIEGKIYNSWSEYSSSPEHLKLIENLEEFKEKYAEEAKKFFFDLEYEDRLKCFLFVSNQIYEAEIIENGTYRYLLYEKMKFNTDAYTLGVDFGVMNLHNSIYSEEELINSIKSLFEFLNVELDDNKLFTALDIIKYGYQTTTNKNKQLSLDFYDIDI